MNVSLPMCIVALSVASATMSAVATPPSLPCDYECLWPIGSYNIPEAATAGEDYVITYTYAWQEIPGDGKIGTLDQKEIPPGRHADGNPAATPMPPGYGGSAVWLQLPDGIDVVSWSAGELEKRALWVDHLGRTTYEYVGLNRHVAVGSATAAITIRVSPGASIYPNDEIRVSLGVRGDSWRSPVLFANMDGDAVRLSGEPARGAVGAVHVASALRDAHVLPGSAVTPLDEGDLVGAAAQSVRSFALGQARGGDFAYAYGYLLVQDRPSDMVGDGANTQEFSGAAGVKACAHDGRSQDGSVGAKPLMVNGEPACSTVGADGFFGIVVPRSDPGDDGSPADIVPVFSLDHEKVAVKRFGRGPIATSVLESTSADGDTVSLGRHTVPSNALFTTAWWMYADALDAHRFFSVLGYDTPYVDVIQHASAYYDTRYDSINLIIEPRGSAQGNLSSSRTVVLHEYGHHIMNSVYDAGIPPQGVCSAHAPGKITNAVCAWTEGWAEFVAIVIDDDPLRRFGLTTKSSYWDYEARETHSRPLTGEHDALSGSLQLTPFVDGPAGEGNITASLWDLYDHGSSEPGDNMSGGLPAIWRTFTAMPAGGETFNAVSIHDFWLDWIEKGHASPAEVFSLNAIPDTLSTASMLDVHVERGGVDKAGIGAGYARAGDTIVAELRAGGRIDTSSTPEAAILGGDLAVMKPAGSDAWVARADVKQGAHDGKIPITVRADTPRIKMAADPISYDSGSDTVTIKTAYEPAGGTHEVVAGSAIADSGGTNIASATSRKFVYNPGLLTLIFGRLSPDGREIVLYFDRGVDGSTATLDNIRLDSRLTPANNPISHEDGSNIVRVRLSGPPPADGRYRVSVSSIDDTHGRTLGDTYFVDLRWNPRPPVLESVTLSEDRRHVTLLFDEEVNRLFFFRRMTDHSNAAIALSPTMGPITSMSHTFRLPSKLAPGSYTIVVDEAKDALGNSIPLQRKVLTYTDGHAPILNNVSVDPGGQSITLEFDRKVSSTQLANRNIEITRRFLPAPSFDIIDIPDTGVSHTDGSKTVKVTLDEKLKDGTYEVVWTRKNPTIGGTLERYESFQQRYFWWNPETPRLESYVVAPDGRSIDFTFSEEMLAESLATYLLPGEPIAIDRDDETTKEAGSHTISLNLAAPLEKGLHFMRLQVSITDVGGLKMASPYPTVFQWDAAPPSLESAGVSADGRSVRLTFSEGLDASTVTDASVVPDASLTTDDKNPIEHVDGSNTVTLKLASEPASGQHTVTARGTIADSTGVPMGKDQARTFTYVPGTPVFEDASISADGSTVTLEFSEGLDASTVTPASIRFVTTNERLLFAQNAGGTPIEVDTTPPRLLDAFFTSASSIRLELSEPPDPGTVTATAFALELESAAVPFTVTPHALGEAAVTLSLASDASSEPHTVSVKRVLADRAGNPAVESPKTITLQDTAGDAPSFTAKRANRVMVIVEFSEAMRVKQGAELGLRDWLFADTLLPTNHHVDLDNRRIVLQFDIMPGIPRLGVGDITYRPISGESALEDLVGYDLSVGSRASTATSPLDFPFFFAETTAEGVVNVRFDRTVHAVPSAFRISGTTAASEWTVNGSPATGVREGATGETSDSIMLTSATGFYLTHATPGAPETLQVKYTKPTGGNSLFNTEGALETTQVTSVNRIRNAFTSGEFADARTLELTSTRTADRRVADHLQVAATGDAPPVTLASGSRSQANPLVEVLRLGADARDGCTYRVSLLPEVASVMGIWTPGGGGQGEVTYTDTHAPVILSASTDGTTTRVLFNEPVAFGASPNITQHRGHWAVTDAGAARQIAAVAVSATDPSTVEITHAALSGTAATPTVAYDGTADDDARIRDTRASPCTDTDATPKNAQGGTLRVVAFDGIAPGASSVSAAVSGDGGAAKSGPNAIWAGIGDTVTVSLAMDEDGHETAAPRLFAAGSNVGMAMGETARLWSGGVSIGAGTSEGALGYTITAPDAAGNLGVFADAGGAEPIARVDTTLPQVASAETTGAGGARVTLSEGAWGLLRASDWTVGGERASGASLGAGGEPSPAVALAGEASFTLHVPGAVGTGATPQVVYSPQAPGAAPDPAGPDAGPAPPQAGITLDVGGLDGAAVRLGESREFPITAAADDAQPIVLLEGNPDFVAVENTGPGTATVTVDASHATAAAGDYTFAVVAATGSGPARAEVTVTLEPAA